MSKITLEQTHALLEKLAGHVMNNVPTKQEMNARFEKNEWRFDKIESELDKQAKEIEQKADKKDVQFVIAALDKQAKEIEQKSDKKDIQLILNGLDAQAKQLDIIRTEQIALVRSVERIEKRVRVLEEKETGYRVQDKE